MDFKDFSLTPLAEKTVIKVDEATEVEVRQYLPIKDKGDLITYVINGAIDGNTGCFSPLRTEVFFIMGIVQWYTNIKFSDDELLENIGETYDKIETSGLATNIIDAIPKEEFDFISELVENTVTDIARYNSSFAGMVAAAGGHASTLDEQLAKILEQIKNKEGMELLSVIKDVGGTN